MLTGTPKVLAPDIFSGLRIAYAPLPDQQRIKNLIGGGGGLLTLVVNNQVCTFDDNRLPLKLSVFSDCVHRPHI